MDIDSTENNQMARLRQQEQMKRKRRFLLFLVSIIGLRQWSRLHHREPYNDAIFGGAAYIKHILGGNARRAQAMLRLSIDTFKGCSVELDSINYEPVSRILSMDKQLGIFLYIVGQNATNRQAQDQFQHSGETISRVFHHIIRLLLQLKSKYIVTPNPKFTHKVILDNPKFSPFFDGCIGALDGCHIPACVPEHLAGPYQNRKGCLAQNVLGVVHACNSFVFRPETKEELYNLRHSMMQNVVERTFGTWKKRFPILVHPLEYSLKTQRDLVIVLDANECAPTGEDDPPPDEDDEEEVLSRARERAANNSWRDRIAQDMWNQYRSYLASRT
ncbi:hypothetical protein PTTG_28493 [Puccinia triticina 1-1 BBBD Race 1]|uniref:DUF8040 domain-containing protein n=1 Tax=Puccinia triticina (isolate 1-1 / race 1 (BBBD)) TaxID=630390 RepID=A0A180GB48_PUCT1|nr:hypothetical protein PTTG_28493 [Puccinia triticina 1-1 BBBD Race 1]